jgi:hypothetical protein
MKRCVLALVALVIAAFPAAAQSKRGTWEGAATSQQGPQRLIVVLDSTASGWSGAAVLPYAGADSIRLVSVVVRADTLSFGIPWNNTTVRISGLVTDGKFSGAMWYNNQNAGSVELTRKTNSEKKP